MSKILKFISYSISLSTCAILFMRSAHAAEVSLEIAPTNWVSCFPVVNATFPSNLEEVTLEWALGESAEFTKIATCSDPSKESWTYELKGAIIGQKRRYRLAMTSGGNTSYSEPVAFTRFRNLDRNPRNRSVLASGVYSILSANSTTMRPFNGSISDYPDSTSYQNTGLKFTKEKVHIAGIRVYPRSDNIGRLNNRSFFGAVNAATYNSEYSAIGYISGLTAAYHYFPSTDTVTAFECCWVKPTNGNISEFEVYGWSESDLVDAGGSVDISFMPYSADETNFWPIVTATYPYGVDSAAIEIGRSIDGAFEELKSVTSPNDNQLVYTNRECKVGQTRYYRLKTVTRGVTYTSTPKKFVRFRWLERGPETPNAVRSGYSVIAGSSGRALYPFNGVIDTSDSYNPCGINFNEQVYVAGVRYYPRPGWVGRLSGRYTYASATAGDYSANVKSVITPFLYCPSEKWYWFDSQDVENPYQYVYISPDSASIGEMEIYGWTVADIAATADPFFPTELTVVNGDDDGQVVLTWRGGLNLDSYCVQYRKRGYEEWHTAERELPTSIETCLLNGLETNTDYEFRVLGYAGYESGSSPISSVYVYQLVPGSGTGLNTLLYGPITSRHLNQRFHFEQRLSPTVDVYQATGSLFANTNLTSAMVIYRGKIILPLTGTYTFTAVVEGTDGSALYINGSECFNAFASASLKKVTKTLDAGEHDIELIYRSVNTKKSFSFTWALEGVWSERPVPMTQLKPAANSEMNLPHANATYDGWDYSPAIGSASYIPRFYALGGTSYRMTGEAQDYNSPNLLSLLTRSLDGPFTLTADFTSATTKGRIALFVSKSPTSLSANCVNYIYTGDAVGLKGGPNNRDWGFKSLWPSASGEKRRLRIRRLRDKTITFSDMDVANGTWVTRFTMPQGVNSEDGWSLAADKLYVGVSLFGNTSQKSDVTFSNLNLSLDNGTVIILR